MRRFPLQFLISWLCLFAFAANVFLQVGMVQCSDGHGGSRLEWPCSRNDRGECTQSCGQGECEKKDGLPHPCDDKPLASDQAQVRAAPCQSNLPNLSVPVFLAMVDPFRIDPPAMHRAQLPRPPAHPPDTLGRLRTVILTV